MDPQPEDASDEPQVAEQGLALHGSGFEDWRQGDVVSIDGLIALDGAGQSQTVPTPDGVVIISQTCDLVVAGRDLIQVAPVVTLAGQTAIDARTQKRPQYLPLGELGDQFFADLEVITTVHKDMLLGAARSAGVSGHRNERKFAAGIARRFGRFAFPDEVSDAMKGLRDLVEARVANTNSPFGRVMDEMLDELRASVASTWELRPYEVTLTLVVNSGDFPTFENDRAPDSFDPSFRERFMSGTPRARIHQISEFLLTDARPEERFWLWQWLSEACADYCNATARGQGMSAEVVSFFPDVVSADQLALPQLKASELVDLAHLSEPTTFAIPAAD